MESNLSPSSPENGELNSTGSHASFDRLSNLSADRFSIHTLGTHKAENQPTISRNRFESGRFYLPEPTPQKRVRFEFA
jgi:hypothetical protein